jgi:hypothetical protein
MRNSFELDAFIKRQLTGYEKKVRPGAKTPGKKESAFWFHVGCYGCRAWVDMRSLEALQRAYNIWQ